MQIDVWVENEMVGTFKLPANAQSKEIPSEFPIIEYGKDKDLAELHNFHWIQTNRRNCYMDEKRLMAGEMEHEVRAHHIPDYARQEVFRDPANYGNRVCFSWYVATPTLDQYEIMFDHPEFVPA